jgi:hypothetical protein
MMPEKIQRDSPVHGPAIDIDIVEFFSQLFGKRTLAARTPAVDGDDDIFGLFHATAN